MDNYFDSYREMVSLRGLSDHTLKSYSTYIRAYPDYLTRYRREYGKPAGYLFPQQRGGDKPITG